MQGTYDANLGGRMLGLMGQMVRLPFEALSTTLQLSTTAFSNAQRLASRAVAPSLPGPRASRGATPSTAAAASPATQPLFYAHTAGAPTPGAQIPNKEERTMHDTNLADDMVKLVDYSIINIKRDDEKELKTDRVLVTDNLTGEAFSAWMIADFVREGAKGTGKDDHKYLRVSYSVRNRWPREEAHYDRDQVKVLERIEEVVRECCEEKQGTAKGAARKSA